VRATHRRLILSTRVEDSIAELALIDASADAAWWWSAHAVELPSKGCSSAQ